MMRNPLVSVIVPIYKVESYLRQCIDSIIHQTYTNLEIILVDDGSPDNSPQICDEFAAKDKRIRVIHKKNGGLSDARNAGLDICKGDYIYFIDGDDYIGSETIDTLCKEIEKNDQYVIAIGYFTALIGETLKIYNDAWLFDRPRIIESNEFAERMLTEKSNHAATAKLYNKKIFQNIRFQLKKKNEDSLFEADLVPIIEKKQYKCIDIPLYSYFYRIHEKSICHSKEDPIVWHIIENCETIINKFSDRPRITFYLRKREMDSLIETLSDNIKENDFTTFWKTRQYLKKVSNNFARTNLSFKIFICFLLLKYTPNLLILKQKIIC